MAQIGNDIASGNEDDMIDTQVKTGSYKDLKLRTLMAQNPMMFYKSQSTQESLEGAPLAGQEDLFRDDLLLHDEDKLKKSLTTHSHELTKDELHAILKE